MTQCPWKIHWAKGQEHTTQCELEEHTDPYHQGKHPNRASTTGHTEIRWMAGDRREYTGEWPGPCVLTKGCVLHHRHKGRCAV